MGRGVKFNALTLVRISVFSLIFLLHTYMFRLRVGMTLIRLITFAALISTLSGFTSPTLANNICTPIHLGDYDAPGSENDVFVSGTTAYVANGFNEGLFIIDVSSCVVVCQCPEDDRGGCISGTVSDGEGKTVILKPLKPNGGEKHRKAITDSNGCYIFSDLKNGRYRVWVIGRCRPSHQIVKIIKGGKVNDVNFGCR